MDRQGNLRKELPFTVGLPVSLMNADTQAEDTVVVQGIIDICGEAEESLWLIALSPGQPLNVLHFLQSLALTSYEDRISAAFLQSSDTKVLQKVETAK